MRRLFLLIVFIAAGWPSSIGEAADVLAAADGRHVYVVRPGLDEAGWEVVHLDAEAGPDHGRTVFRTPRRPEAIAAVGDRCILVLAPFDATRPTPLAISFRVAQHPLNDVWFADPPGDPRVLPPLPTGGELAGIAAAPLGELIVHRPSQRLARGVARTGQDRPSDSAAADEGEAGRATVIGEEGAIHLLATPGRQAWEPVETPASFESAIGVSVGRLVAEGRTTIGLVWRTAGGDWRLGAFGASGWSVATVDGLPDGLPVSLATVDDRSLLAIRDESGVLQIVDLVATSGTVPASGGGSAVRARPFTSLPTEAMGPRATMVATSGGPWIIGLDGTEVRIATVDRVDGRVSAPVVASEQEVEGSLVEYPIYAGLILALMTAAFVLRPHIERQPATIAEGLSPAGPLRRAAGLCIDLVPGLMVAIAVFDLEPAIFAEDLRAGAPKAMLPAVFAMMVASGITVLLEGATGRSLGKWVVGTRVAALDGSPGTRWQRGLRAGLRLALLLFWPIALLALLDPAGRGMPELLTRTVVVVAKRSTPSPATADPGS